MKLAIIRQKYTPYGGAEKFVSQALQTLSVNNDLQLLLFTRKWQDLKNNHENSKNFFEPIICNPFYIGSLWRDFSFLKSVENKIKIYQPDLVQSHERTPFCDIFRAGDGLHQVWLQERLKNANFWQKWSIKFNPTHWFRLAMEKNLFNSTRLKAVICISHMVKNEILLAYPNIADKLHVIYNSVDSQAFSPKLRNLYRPKICQQLNISPQATIFTLIGSGYERKGVKTAMLALAKIHKKINENNQFAHLIIVGKDKHLRKYQKIAAELQITSQVHFIGGVEDTKPYYAAADVFVLPTLYDPLSNAVLEALSCGLPVLTSEKCGAGEIVQKFSAGLLCDARDESSLAYNMLHYFLQPEIRKIAGKNARSAAKTLTPETMRTELVNLYLSLLKK